MKPGTYVSRAVYAKLQAENRRLLADIKVMACGEVFDAIQMRIKWRKRFRDEEMLNQAIKKAARQYVDEHPEMKEWVEGLSKKQSS